MMTSGNISIESPPTSPEILGRISDVGDGDMDEISSLKEHYLFESPSHRNHVLCGLNHLRNKSLLVDVTLVAGGQAFEAHRVVLASCSDYFRVMFTTEVLESKQREVKLEGVSANGMHFILDYAYTSQLTLNLGNIQDILAAASHVQLETVVEACSTYLLDQLDLENCVDIVTLAETYSLTQLKKRVYSFISSHLMEFSQTTEFNRLSAPQLEYLLDCDNPVDCPESDVLQIVLQWLNFCTSRLPLSSLLLGKIHYEEISPSVLKMIWEHSILGCLCGTDEILYRRLVSHMFPGAESVREGGRLSNSISQKQSKSTLALSAPNALRLSKPISSLINSRGMEEAIIKVGGFGIAGITNEVTYFLPSVGQWKRLSMIPHVETAAFGTAVLDNQLYVVGGCFNQYLQENIHPFGFCYNPRFAKWTTMAPMLTERCRFTLNAVGNKLYAIGGASENVEDSPNPEDFCPCEQYDPEADSWHAISPLAHARTQHAGAAWRKMLFISGGLEQDIVSNSLICYNTSSNTWESRAPMLTPRADHSIVVYQDKLYVAGGWYEDESIGNRLLVNTIDEYDVLQNRWRVVTNIPTPRYHAGITTLKEKLFIIGGFHSDATFDRTTGVIECLDLETFDWTTVDRYPQDIWEHTCATLYIPKCREDIDVLPS